MQNNYNICFLCIINIFVQVSHTFVNYPPNIRFVKITRGGKDTQFWAGHYGSKMAGANVHVTLPVLMKDESVQEDIE